MAHKCVRCGRVYENNNEIVLKGCICGSKLFVFIPDNKLTEKDREILEKTKKELENLKNKKRGLEEDNKKENSIYDKRNKEENKDKFEEKLKELFNIKKEDVLVLPLEAVRVIEDGKFLIDVNKLFQEKIVVIKTREGQYVIQLF